MQQSYIQHYSGGSPILMVWNLNVLNYVREYVKKLQVDSHAYCMQNTGKTVFFQSLAFQSLAFTSTPSRCNANYTYQNCLRELFHREPFGGSFCVNKSRDIVFFFQKIRPKMCLGQSLKNGRFWVLVSILETQYRQNDLFVLPIYEYQNFATFTFGTFKNWINGLTKNCYHTYTHYQTSLKP